MNKDKKVAYAVIRRLPRYLRTLDEMIAEGEERTSSAELSEKIGYTASQIRQDLNHFGCFGQQGYGYVITELRDEISHIMGLDKTYKMVIVGCGRLGKAIASHTIHNENQFKPLAMFDINPDVIGSVICGLPVLDDKWIEEYVRDNEVDIGVITAPAGYAQDIANRLKAGGIKGIWNYAIIDLEDLEGVKIVNMHLADSLKVLTYYINEDEGK